MGPLTLIPARTFSQQDSTDHLLDDITKRDPINQVLREENMESISTKQLNIGQKYTEEEDICKRVFASLSIRPPKLILRIDKLSQWLPILG